MNARPIPWRVNLTVVAAQVSAAMAIFWLTALASNWWQIGLLAVAFALVGNSIYASMHEAEHGILLPVRFYNDALGVALAAFFPAPFHLLRQSHLGHHWRNRSDDEAFDYFFPGESALWKRLQLYGILTGMFWITIVLSNVLVLVCPFVLQGKLVAFDRPTTAFMDSLNPRYWRWIQAEALLAIVFHAGTIWLLGVPITSYLVVYFGFGLVWSGMQYVHHFGTPRHVINGSRNLWLSGPIDVLWLHHNWHHTHHQHPTLPWIYLKEASVADGAQREFLLWHYVRMWRGPRLTTEHVENRYAGRIIQ